MLQLWFGRSPVSRAQYVRHGFALLILKYALDSLIIFIDSGAILTPWVYLHPSMAFRLEGTRTGGLSFLIMGLVSLPFIWAGISMTMRRARQAGLSIWFGLLFFLPLINWLLIVALCFAPDQPHEGPTPAADLPPVFGQALKALAAGVGVGLLALVVSVFGFGEYGAGLFAGAPFVIGVVSAFMVAKSGKTSVKSSLGIAWLALTLCAGAMLLLALEGGICLITAWPLGAALTTVGALVGRSFAQTQGGPSVAALIVALPLTTAVPVHPDAVPLRAAVSEVIVDATPDQVWPHVVSFPDLPPPSDWLLKTGVACPLRARIDGEGVGAVRHCEFTTGAFVEPITVWNPPYRLAFDVTEQPPPMHEWSPYKHVHAPHLVSGMQSQRGEFKLEALPGGKTRLIGTTWYTIDMAPQPYWGWYADKIVHRIHRRVLRHVKNLAER